MPSIPIIMPQLGESIAEATIVSFLVQPGDQIEAGQDIIEVETNKANMNVASPCRGRLEKFTVQLSESYAVGATLGRIEISAADAALLGRAAVLPQPGQLIYQGALSYSANFDAMHYFLTDIFPHIQAAAPEVSLKITGASPSARVAQLPHRAGVSFTGYLPDIHTAVAEAWACVVPLRIGGGTRLKILEALALGTPVISTSKGVEGLDVMHDQQLLIADDPIEFAAQTLRVLRDPALRARLAENGRHLIKSKYNWQLVGDQFNRLIDSLSGEQV